MPKKTLGTNKYLIMAIIGFCAYVGFGQTTATLSGIILNTQNQPLVNANVLAFPEAEDASPTFSISNNKGQYKLILVANLKYQIEVSYLGYQKFSFSYTAQQNNTKKVVLSPQANELDEVVVSYKIPITVTQDTITYQTDAFTNGKERKLREVLKKLPGIEVDRQGNVTAQGRKITKVLVEDETFFNGNSKLAVNNIPANAVNEVQVLDNYNDIAFLKGLQDSDELALNIKLKKDKKKFAFGDLETAAGIKERYALHPTLFYYSPNTKVNFIGDVNNVGTKSFSLNDYLEFNGGVGKLLSDVGSFINLTKDDFSQFLNQNNFTKSNHAFGAFNVRQKFSKSTALNSYVIANSNTSNTLEQTLNIYNTTNGQLIEDRNQANTLRQNFAMGKLTLSIQPNTQTNFDANTFAKLTNNQNNGQLTTASVNQDNLFNNQQHVNAVDLQQNFSFHKNLSQAHTLSTEATVKLNQIHPEDKWQTNAVFLPGLIPLVIEDAIMVRQEKTSKNINANMVFKEYWVLNSNNHIYSTLGTNFLWENYNTAAQQILASGQINNLETNGFGNQVTYNFNDTFFGLEYKFLVGKLTVKSGLFYHNYYWTNQQKNEQVKNTTQALLPALKAHVTFNNSEKITAQYRQKYDFAAANKLGQDFVLNSFNTVIAGNPYLQNSRSHNYSLSYYKFSLFKGLRLNARLDYTKNTQSIKRTTALQGINQYTTYTMFTRPEKQLNAIFRLYKKVKQIKYGLNTSVRYNQNYQLLNEVTSLNSSRGLSLGVSAQTYYKKIPEITLSYDYKPTQFMAQSGTNNFNSRVLELNVEYSFFNDFTLTADYTNTNYRNSTQNITNILQLANANLFYQKEDSKWRFEISATNIFNVGFKRQNTFNDFLVSDQTIYIMPRIILGKVVYKL